MTVEELFGTLQQAVVGSWRKHLRTAKYGKHEALDEFYKEMPEKVDALIEAWMGANGKKIGNFENLLKSANYNTLSYLKELKKICKQGYDLFDDNEELESLLDDIVNLINSTLYKVKELSESSVIDLKDYIMEQLINESVVPGQIMFTSNNWCHITTGEDREDLNYVQLANVDEKFEKFFNKEIKTNFVKACKKDGLNIKVKYLNSVACKINGVDNSNVEIFFKHFYEMMDNAGYTLYADDVYSLFADTDIAEDTVGKFLDDYDIE